MVEPRRDEDLVLPPGTFAHTMDTTTGLIKVWTGPNVVGRGGTDKPVKYDYETGGFQRVELEQAGQKCVLVPQGHYARLWNPAENGKHPIPNEREHTPTLLQGQRVNIPGPFLFAPWPGQSAKVFEGHRLQSNQYLQVQVYDAQAARENLKNAVFESVSTGEEGKKTTKKKDGANAFAGIDAESLSAGQIIIIKGTDVSFFIPPTGMAVVPEEDQYRSGGDKYVREAQTLEALQYCILVDESGSKSYPKGPDVVFPEASQEFFSKNDKEGNTHRVFQAIELNGIQGIHIKVIAAYEGDYTDPKTYEVEEGHKFSEGDEFFIKNCIYYPQEEHSVVKYDGVTKHFATVVPEGEGRYVMDRLNGKITLIPGPEMLLPNPVHQVIVQRVLSDQQSSDWYPGNKESSAFNEELRKAAKHTPSTRRGGVSQGELDRSRGNPTKGASLQDEYASNAKLESAGSRGRGGPTRSHAGPTQMSASSVSRNTDAVMTSSDRKATYQQPRKVVFGNKFDGVPTIAPHIGYCVMVVDKSGGRKVITGPESYLMQYGETLQVLELSTGKPKNTDRRLRSVYLKYANNQVSDIISVVTKDHVEVEIKLSYQVNFEGFGDKDKMASWFSVDNYVKFMCDRMRSILKSFVRSKSIVDFHAAPEEALRDVILGAKGKKEDANRPGKFFSENNMRIFDVEVLDVVIQNHQIRGMLEEQQVATFTDAIKVQNADRSLATTKKIEASGRGRLTEMDVSKQHSAEIKAGEISRTLVITLAGFKSDLESEAEKLKVQTARDETITASNVANINRRQAMADYEAGIEKVGRDGKITLIEAETKAAQDRLGAFINGDMAQALMAIQDAETLDKVARSLSVQQLMGGDSLSETLNNIFAGTPLAEIAKQLTDRMTENGTGKRDPFGAERPRA